MKFKYAVIVCPNCKKAKIIETDKKTTTCTHCNKKHKIQNLILQFETNHQQEARKVIGLLNASQGRKMDTYKNFL